MCGQLISFAMLFWFLCRLLCAVLSLSSLHITLAICLCINFWVPCNCVPLNVCRACAVDCFTIHDHHMLYLSTVSWYNKLNKSKNHPSTSVYYLLFVKCNFVFTLRNSSPAKTWPTGLSTTALAHGMSTMKYPV